MGRSHDQTGSDPSRDQAPKPVSNQSYDKEREHDLMHTYFCRCNLCYIHDVKPAAGRRATSDFSCGLIDKRTEGPLEVQVDC